MKPSIMRPIQTVHDISNHNHIAHPDTIYCYRQPIAGADAGFGYLKPVGCGEICVGEHPRRLVGRSQLFNGAEDRVGCITTSDNKERPVQPQNLGLVPATRRSHRGQYLT